MHGQRDCRLAGCQAKEKRAIGPRFGGLIFGALWF